MLKQDKQRAKALRISTEGNFSLYDTRCSGEEFGQFDCPYCGGIVMQPEKAAALGAALETIREAVNRPIKIRGVRCEAKNRIVQGKAKSRHLAAFGGDAVDIPLSSRAEVELCAGLIEKSHAEIGGIGLYAVEYPSEPKSLKSYWLHIDARPRMKNGRPLKWTKLEIY